MPIRTDKAQITPSGILRVDATLTRTGIFEYQEGDLTIKEYRPPEEVFAPESLESLKGVPVTLLHPEEMVDTTNYKEHSIGHVGDSFEKLADMVKGTLYIHDADAIEQIKSGKLSEISLGYEAELEDSQGTTSEGLTFDRIQRRIRYNHAAVGAHDWGRAGRTVRIILDSKYCERIDMEENKEEPKVDEAPPEEEKFDMEGGLKKMMDMLGDMSKKLDMLTAPPEKEDSEDEEVEMEDKKDSADFEKAVTDAVEARELARDAGVEGKFDGLSNLELLQKASEKLGIDAGDKSDEYLKGVITARLDAKKSDIRQDSIRLEVYEPPVDDKKADDGLEYMMKIYG